MASRAARQAAIQWASRLVRTPGSPYRRAGTDKLLYIRDDGLTGAEGVVADHLVGAVNAYARLPIEHPDDMRDVANAVHRVQDLLAVRIARRTFPKGWPRKT